MNTGLAVTAAIGCAICNAVAAILQKISSDKARTMRTYDVGVLVRLFRQVPYSLGIVLDLIGGVCTLLAVNRLPLFVVQAIIACCVVLTAFLERIFLKRKLHGRTYYASLIVLAGLVCIATAAHSEKTAVVGTDLRYTIAFLPLLLIAIGAVAIKAEHRASAFVLAALSGCAFGGVSIIGRILVYPHPLWLLAKDALPWSLVVYGALGIFFFTAALQRTLATVVNGVMTSAQTVVPLIIGVTLLGDTARHGLWLPLWLGCLLVTCGCAYIAYTD